MSAPYSEDDLRAQIAAMGKLSQKDEDDLLACRIDELQRLLATYRDAAAPADKTAFDEVLVVLGYMAQVAGPIATIASAFAAIFGVAAATKPLTS